MLDSFLIIGTFMIGASAGALVTYAKCKPILNQRSEVPKPTVDHDNMLDPADSRFRMKALIVGRDPEMCSIFSQLFREKHIQAQQCFDESGAMERLASEKFAALVLDVDDVSQYADILNRLAVANKRVPVFAVGSKSSLKQIASALGVSSGVFLVERPLVPSEIQGLLRAAYGSMFRDEQRYFRLAAQLPVSIRRSSGPILQCTTLNVSQAGMAVTTPSSFTVGEQVNIAFAIPNTDIFVGAAGKVLWDDKQGKAGMAFQCSSPSIQARYHEWLQDHFFMTLDGPRAILIKSEN